MTRVLQLARRLWWKPLAVVAGAATVLTVPLWGGALLSHLSFFRLRRVEVEGVRYVAPSDIIARLGVDTTASVWIETRPLEARVAEHPQVRRASIGRKLPGTLVVRVTENFPVAFVPARDGLRAVDATGRLLPIDPSRTLVDLPVVPRPDSAVLRLLAALREEAPDLFDRISNARRAGRGEVVLQIASLRVLAPPDVTVGRLADIVPVERDLARRNVRVAELDLRFRDQVVARLQ